MTYTYDANDRLLTETLDSTTNTEDTFTEYTYEADQQTGKQIFAGLNGSGTLLSETTYDYNLQGRMAHVEIDSDGDGIVDETIDYEYDYSGIRTKQVVDNGTVTTTKYLIDRHNLTGYQQIVEEIVNDALKRSYVLGLDVISQADVGQSSLTLLYDGHGSTRGLVDALGNRLSGEIYQYDAYGNPIGFNQSLAATTMLYSGEQFDSWIGMQYLRARYYDPNSGRFNRLDPFAGNSQDPQSFHKYLYAHGNPVMGVDPSGLMSLATVGTANAIGSNVDATDTAVQQATFQSVLTTVTKDIAWTIAKKSLFNAMSYFLFERELNKAKEQLAFLAIDISGLRLPHAAEVAVKSLYSVYSTITSLTEPVGSILNIPLVRTVLLGVASGVESPIQQYAKWYGTFLKTWRYAKLLFGATVGIPLIIESSEHLFRAIGVPIRIDWTSSLKPSLMSLQIISSAVPYSIHGQENPLLGLKAVKMSEIIVNMRKAVRRAKTSQFAGIETAADEYIRELNNLFGWTLTARRQQ